MIFTYQGKDIHYQEQGQGHPLLLLNGVMMSTESWAPFIAPFSQNHRLILIDLMDQGKSAAFPEGYRMADQAAMLQAFLDHLGLARVSVLGTSYGGALALQLACDAPGRVDRLLLAATRAWTDPLFRDMCESWLHATASPQAFYTATIPLFYGATFQRNQAPWMAHRRELLEASVFNNPDFLARMGRLIRSIMDFDLRERIGRISCPTLVLAPEEDLVMMPWENRRIAQAIPGAELITLPATGHVLFLERPELFTALAMGWFDYRREIPIP
jgi:pimeloyl-ACP methyl ester carboxylesterase